MRSLHITMAWSMLVYMSMLAGVAAADDGVGACAAGVGFSIADIGAGVFIGVNVGTASDPAVYESQSEYETACCAETGAEPDCFEPVQ